MMQLHGGSIPFPDLQRLITALPNSILSASKRDAVAADFPAVIRHLLRGNSRLGLNATEVRNAVDFLEKGIRGEDFTNAIFSRLSATVTPETFMAEARSFASGRRLSDRQEIYDLMRLVQNYQGLYPEGSDLIYLTPSVSPSGLRYGSGWPGITVGSDSVNYGCPSYLTHLEICVRCRRTISRGKPLYSHK